MSTAHLITAYYNAFNARDWPGMLALLSETVRHDINQGSVEVGRNLFHTFLLNMDEHYSEQVEDLVVMVADNEQRASAEFFINGVYKKSQPGLPPASGQSYRIPVGAFFDIADGAITRITNYYNLPNWMAEVSR